ncbi:MAG: hypothetical protein CVV27_03630 [Candidatus Melainabacteria bacterium HGW-Melainabacteria-1]|nr:MAG: hypothetical protein CVV27_03630 [Candidatus Melainabacteria bacterium HGW-Melainabacteria-1]
MTTPDSKAELPEHLRSAEPALQMLYRSMAENGADLMALHEMPPRPFTGGDGMDKHYDEFLQLIQKKSDDHEF